MKIVVLLTIAKSEWHSIRTMLIRSEWFLLFYGYFCLKIWIYWEIDRSKWHSKGQITLSKRLLLLCRKKNQVILLALKSENTEKPQPSFVLSCENKTCRAFNIFQVYQYFTSYRSWYFLLKFEWISYTTLFKIRRYQRPY